MTQFSMFQPQGIRRNAAQMDADFVASVLEVPTREILGMVRGTDGIESQRGAVKVSRGAKCEAMRTRILFILATEGPMTDRELELRVEWCNEAPSTVRKRRVELLQAGKVEKCGRRDNMATWRIAG